MNTITDPHDWATSYLLRHQASHLDDTALVNRTAEEMVVRFAHLGHTERVRTALRAWSAIQAGRCQHFFDLDESTSHVLFIRSTQGGRSVALTIHEVLQAVDLLRQQQGGVH